MKFRNGKSTNPGIISISMKGLESSEKSEKRNPIIEMSLKVIRERYGNGEAGSKLEYHNEEHTLTVLKDTKTLIQKWNESFPDEKISAREAELLEIAAAGHDRVQNAGDGIPNTQPGDDEFMSAAEVAKDMRESGQYTEREIRFVYACIVGTTPDRSNGKVTQPMTNTRRMLTQGQITQREFELAKLICDADLAAFGKDTETFMEQGAKYFKEIQKDFGSREAFLKNQRSTLKNHRWISRVGENAFPKKKIIIADINHELPEAA
jgi:hypothetical protein